MTALALTLKVSLILGAAFLAAAAARHRSAATRHLALATGIVCSLLMPVLPLVLPAWPLWTAPAEAPPAVSVSTTLSLPEASAVPTLPAPATSPFDLLALATTIWAAGAAASLAMLLLGAWRLRRLTLTARPIAGDWPRHAHAIEEALGVRRPVRLLESSHPALLVTWGQRRATVLLPAGAGGWPEPRVRIALAHEIAHVSRGDWGVQVAAALLRALHWWNPIVWLACRRLRLESECACDDAVLRLGVTGASYAEELVALARSFSAHPRVAVPAPAIARPSTLQRRVRAMLNASLDRRPPSLRNRLFTIAALVAIALPVTLVAWQTTATLSGTVTDPSGRPMPGVTIALTSASPELTVQTHSDGSGAFQVPLVPGSYQLAAKVPGFQAATDTLTVGSGEAARRDIQLQIGTLMETITVSQGAPEARRAPAAPAPPAAKATGAAAACAPTEVGGNIKIPRKIKDVKPIYPVGIDEASGPHAVVIAARIGVDGTVTEAHAAEPAAPAIEAAALAAVRQWRFTPTLLNCEPVEVSMTVNVSFVAQR